MVWVEVFHFKMSCRGIIVSRECSMEAAAIGAAQYLDDAYPPKSVYGASSPKYFLSAQLEPASKNSGPSRIVASCQSSARNQEQNRFLIYDDVSTT